MFPIPKLDPQSQPDLLTLSLRELQRLIDPTAEDPHADLRAFYSTPDGIVPFVQDILGVDDVAPYQAEILRTFVEFRRIAARGPHGLGKTALSSWVILWAMSVFDTDVKVICTASAWRQLRHYTFPEARKWATRAHWHKLGMQMRRNKEILELSIKLRNNKEAFAVASDNEAFIEGAHASKLIYVFDEAKAIPVPTWDAAEGAFSTGDCYALAISTPGETSGRFYDICTRKPGYEDWKTRHVKLEEAVAAGRIRQDWVDDRKKQWGEKSAVYKNRVLGEFDDSGEDNVVPLSWVEKAIERWHEKNGKGEGRVSWGVDPAYKGEDKTTIAKMVGRVVEKIEAHSKEDTIQTTGRVASQADKESVIAVDVIGVGAGVYDQLRNQRFRVLPVNVSHKAEYQNGKPMTDVSGEIKFLNLRAAIWWMLRDALDPDGDDPLALPPSIEDKLVGDLTAPKYEYTNSGQIKIESKDDLRERIGRSTDYADAVGLALYAATRRAGPVTMV